MDLIEVIFPGDCPACGGHLYSGNMMICASCHLDLPVSDFYQLMPNPFSRHFLGRVPIRAGAAMFHFSKEGKARNLVHRIKYHKDQKLGVQLGEWYGKHIRHITGYGDVDGIIPVPLHPKKLKKRGFNQCSSFAEGLSRILQVPVWEDVLVRTLHGKSLTGMSRAARTVSMSSAFQCVFGEIVRGKKCLLVDDVLTTGSTLEACAHELLKVPEVQLSMATIAMGQS